MHTLVEVPVGANGGTHVPAFLAKLWKIVDDPQTNDLIGWSEMGNSFIIKNQAKFARDLLPSYYKHNNMASFVRQLNMYGFHKVVSVEQGGLRVDKDEMEFAHPFFLKGQETSLELIKRKIPASKHEESRMRPESFNKVLMDVRQMKGRQETMDNKLVTMKRENEALWRELASLRQKHAKQTQIVSKLLQFLVGMMSQQTPRLGFKRRMPLMLNDKDGVKQKLARTEGNQLTGPVIHDVTELLESDDSVEDLGDQDCTIAQDLTCDKFKVDSPLSVANITAKNPFTAAAAVGGHMTQDNSEILFQVDPANINSAVSSLTLSQLQQSFQNAEQAKPAKTKGKVSGKRSSVATTTSIKTEPTTAFPSQLTGGGIQNTSQSQMMQIPGISTVTPQTQNQNNVNVPTTLYFSAPGMSEPVQVVLSIPNQAPTTVPSTSGVNSIASPIVIPSTNATTAATGKPLLNIQQQQPAMNMTNIPLNNGQPNNTQDNVARNQSVNNPRILVKSNGNVVQQDLDGHLDEMEVGLNNLKDLFKSSNDYQVDGDTLIRGSTSSRPFYNIAAIDPDTYSQLFNGSQNVDNAENQANQDSQLQMVAGDANVAMQEVVSYNPSLFELAEDDSNFFDESSNMFLDDELESMLTTDRNSLKSSDVPNRTVGQLTFSGMNLHNSFDAGLHTPMTEHHVAYPSTSTGAAKRKRK